MATLGKSNLGNIEKVNVAENIVLVLDNDKVDWQADKKIVELVQSLKAKDKLVSCIQPRLMDGKKTDYNDLLKAGKLSEIVRDISGALQQEKDLGKPSAQPKILKTEPVLVKEQKDRELVG